MPSGEPRPSRARVRFEDVEEGRDGTRLPGCLKVYVPMPAGPWGIVFQIVVDDDGALLMAGVRAAAPCDTKRQSVYRLAHARLHAVDSLRAEEKRYAAGVVEAEPLGANATLRRLMSSRRAFACM